MKKNPVTRMQIYRDNADGITENDLRWDIEIFRTDSGDWGVKETNDRYSLFPSVDIGLVNNEEVGSLINFSVSKHHAIANFLAVEESLINSL